MISEAETVAAQATQKCDGDESAISKEIKLYFDDKDTGFINGILDSIARKVRKYRRV